MSVLAHPDAESALQQLLEELRRQAYRFITITPASHHRVNGHEHNRWAQDLRGIFGWNRLFHENQLPTDLFEALRNSGLVQREGDGWRSRVRVSSLDDGLIVHSAFPTDDNDAVFFGPDSYRFIRAIDLLLSRISSPVHRAADIGTGTGIGAMRIAQAHESAYVEALDINAQALALAGFNAQTAGLKNIAVQHSNLLQATSGEYDLIVANPPYMLDGAERAYRHGGGELGEGLAVAIVEAAVKRLALGGTLLLYTGVAIAQGRDPLLEAIQPYVQAPGLHWLYEETDPDVFGEELEQAAYARVDRIAVVVLTVTRVQ